MTMRHTCSVAMILAAAGGAMAQANYKAQPVPAGQEPVYTDDAGHDMDWNTVDSGGGTLSGDGALSIEGTVGQADAGDLTGGSLTMAGGYWMTLAPSVACYANCDQSTTPPALNVLDFNCFLNHFSGGDSYANCDSSTTPPVLNVLDFNCFINAFFAGCP
jgi:hypothetical protein